MPKKDNENVDRERNLSLAINQINKEFGNGAIMKLGDKPHSDVSVISTGALSLDMALGVYGMPRGRVVEIYGPESSGKTTVCLHTVANAQKAGGTCAFIDTEHALDPQYARLIGVNTQDLLVAQPDCGEDALNIAQTLISSNSIDVLVIDSVAALTPRAELDGQIGDSHVGLHARLMSSALRSLTGAINKTRTCLIFTNQLREKIGVMYGNPETTPGGKALKFYASIRLEIRRAAAIQNPSGDVLGNRVKVKVVKNKIAPPFRKAEFDIMYNEGISRTGSLLDLGIEHGILTKKGAWISYDGNLVGQGREAAKQALAENEKLMTEITNSILEKVEVNVGSVLAQNKEDDN